MNQKSSVGVVNLLIIIVILIGLGFLFVRAVKARLPSAPDQSLGHAILNQEHIKVGDSHGEYNSNPPSSGWHIGGSTAGLGFYDLTDAALPDELIIHNLEHGEIWVAYRPPLLPAIENGLKQLVAEEPWLIVTPREKNDTDIAVVAWGRVDKFNLSPNDDYQGDLDRIRGFIARYKNRGPEKVAPEVHKQK